MPGCYYRVNYLLIILRDEFSFECIAINYRPEVTGAQVRFITSYERFERYFLIPSFPRFVHRNTPPAAIQFVAGVFKRKYLHTCLRHGGAGYKTERFLCRLSTRSELFHVGNGTKQGGVFFPYLLTRQAYLSQIITEICLSKVGCKIGTVPTNIFTARQHSLQCRALY